MQKLSLLSILLAVFFVFGCEKEDMNPSTPDEPIVVEPEPEPMPTIDTMTTTDGVQFVRTPDEYFDNLPDWPYAYQYIEINGLRQAYAEAGPANGEVVLLLHGQPSWSYLYRHMMPTLANAGYRVIAMDHLGMGRSDKPVNIEDYSYLGHADRLESFILEMGISDINLFVQDWGSLIGLRVAGLNPDWFATISVGNGDLPLIPAGASPYPPVNNPNEVEDIPSPFAAIPDQQVPFYDGCDLILQGVDAEENFGEALFNVNQILYFDNVPLVPAGFCGTFSESWWYIYVN